MALLVWITMGVALWHFTVFVPDRFWGGIVGALIGSVFGSVVVGAIFQIALGRGIGETDLATALIAIPGVLLGLGITYWLGTRNERKSGAAADA